MRIYLITDLKLLYNRLLNKRFLLYVLTLIGGRVVGCFAAAAAPFPFVAAATAAAGRTAAGGRTENESGGNCIKLGLSGKLIL